MKRFKTVDEYIDHFEEYQRELKLLRKTALSVGLEETVKWGAPVYTVNGKNVLGLGAFKSYVGLWFHQGALLKDKSKKLLNAQEGKTKALRQWRFDSFEEMDAKLIRSYMEEAVANQQAGKEIKPERKKPLVIPDELAAALDDDPKLKACFEEFTLGKKREFADHISEAKRAETKTKRLEKIIPMILEKKGLHDKYRNC